MTRLVAVVVPAPAEPRGLAAAMLDDVVDLVAAMQRVEGALVAAPAALSMAAAAAWPGMPVCPLPGGATAGAAGAGAAAEAGAGAAEGAGGEVPVAAALTAVAGTGAGEVAVLAADVPDLPALLIGKLFSALTSAAVAVCPAADGRLVALATALPPPPWLPPGLSLETVDAAARLREAAPSLRSVQLGPGWRRVRSPEDARRLDPGLEGWEATRTWLESAW